MLYDNICLFYFMTTFVYAALWQHLCMLIYDNICVCCFMKHLCMLLYDNMCVCCFMITFVYDALWQHLCMNIYILNEYNGCIGWNMQDVKWQVCQTHLELIDPATGELDKGSWYVTCLPTLPTYPPRTLPSWIIKANPSCFIINWFI